MMLAPLMLMAQGEKKRAIIPEQLNKLMITENVITEALKDNKR